jgi:thymidine kinase
MPSPTPDPLGRLTVICGPMFAGKTTALIDRLRAAARAGQTVAVFKPARDARYDLHALCTHAGTKINASAVEHGALIPHAAGGTPVVAIDEAHFFGSDLIEPVLALLAARKSVIIAGLERDHRGQPFDPMPRLLCEADEVIKLSGPCASCGRPAIHSQRLIDSPDRIVVGGAETYEPRCRECFTPGR